MSTSKSVHDSLSLEGLDLGDLSLEGLEITSLGDARNLPEMGASSISSSCKSTSCCGSSSCCLEIEESEKAAVATTASLDDTQQV